MKNICLWQVGYTKVLLPRSTIVAQVLSSFYVEKDTSKDRIIISWISDLHKVLQKDFIRKEVFFAKLLGSNVFVFFQKSVPPRHNTSHLWYLLGTISFLKYILYFGKTSTQFQQHGLSIVHDRGHGYSNSFNYAQVYTSPISNKVTTGKNPLIARRQYTSVRTLIKTFHNVHDSTNIPLRLG